MIDDVTLAAVRRRLTRALAPPVLRYRPLQVDGNAAGWLTDARAERLARFADVFAVNSTAVTFVPALAQSESRSAAMAHVAAALADEGALTAWRDECYAVAPAFGAPPWFVLERAAARYFGVHTWAAHVNGLVRDGERTLMWLARRSPTKAIDPGMLDNLVGGGIAAGARVEQTVLKEAWEEAGIAEEVARHAQAAGAVHIRREQPDGLHSETIFVHDLWLPSAFAPANQDGEAVAHRRVTMDDVAALIAIDAGPDTITADASLVALDCLLRHDVIASDQPEFAALRAIGTMPPRG